MAESLLGIQLAIGLVFLISSIAKIRYPKLFVASLAEYGLVNNHAACLAGYCVMGTELFLAVAHLTGWGLTIALPTGLLLLAMFFIVVSVALLRRQVVTCLCFGAGATETISPLTLARVALLLTGQSVLTVAWLRGYEWPVPYMLQIGGLIPPLLLCCTLLIAASWAKHTFDLLTQLRLLGFRQATHSTRRNV